MSEPAALPLQTRLAPLRNVDADARTVEVVWTTGAAVRRCRWVGWDTPVPFMEELLVTADAIDLTRLKNGAPLLDSHATYSTEEQRGVVEDAWIAGGEGLALTRFPEKGTDDKADRLFELVRQKIIRNVSVGYSIDQVRVIEGTGAQIERRVVEKWTPYELSFVTVPADPGAQARNAETRSFPITVLATRRLPDLAAEAARARMALRARGLGLTA